MSLIDKHHVFDYPMNVNYVFERIMSAIPSMRGLSFKRKEPPYTVVLSSGVSMSSWGENVTIACNYLDESHTRISITSAPVVPTTLIDFGKGKKNINNVMAVLKQVLPPVQSMPPAPSPPSSMPPPLP